MSEDLPPLRLGNQQWPYSPDVHGWTIKKTATHQIDVCRLLFHYRIATTPLTSLHSWDHGWCYSGNRDDLMQAVIAACAWDPDTEAEPWGWAKRACHCVRTIEAGEHEKRQLRSNSSSRSQGLEGHTDESRV